MKYISHTLKRIFLLYWREWPWACIILFWKIILHYFFPYATLSCMGFINVFLILLSLKSCIIVFLLLVRVKYFLRKELCSEGFLFSKECEMHKYFSNLLPSYIYFSSRVLSRLFLVFWHVEKKPFRNNFFFAIPHNKETLWLCVLHYF